MRLTGLRQQTRTQLFVLIVFDRLGPKNIKIILNMRSWLKKTTANKQNQNTTLIITSPFGMEDKVFNIIILIFLLISQILIAFFVSQYYYLLPSKKDRQRITHSSSL